MKSRKTAKKNNELSRLVELQIMAEKLPRLSAIEKAKFDHSLAVDQLYYSSKVEGSNLTKDMLDGAIYGRSI